MSARWVADMNGEAAKLELADFNNTRVLTDLATNFFDTENGLSEHST
jgi:hypothetical protein